MLRKLLAALVSCLFINRKYRKFVRDFIQNFSLIDYLKFKKNKYRVLSLGSFCFPRVVTTYSKIKPRRIYGEKSSVFDLAFHSSIDEIIKLIDSDFVHFFDDIRFDEKENCWVNDKLNAVYNHESKLNKDDFFALYKKRIENFYDYLNDDKFLLCIYSINHTVKNTKEDIQRLYDVLKRKRGNKEFAFVLINHAQSSKDISLDMKNSLFIDASYFDMTEWADKVRKTQEGKDFVNKIGNEIKDFLKTLDM